jgi:hypothetical protein
MGQQEVFMEQNIPSEVGEAKKDDSRSPSQVLGPWLRGA